MTEGNHENLRWEMHDQIHQLEQDARELAHKELDRRLADMNAFRTQLREQAADFVTRRLHDDLEKALSLRIDTARDTLDQRIRVVETAVNDVRAEQKGSRLTVRSMYAAIAALGTVLTILIIVVNIATKK